MYNKLKVFVKNFKGGIDNVFIEDSILWYCVQNEYYFKMSIQERINWKSGYIIEF